MEKLNFITLMGMGILPWFILLKKVQYIQVNNQGFSKSVFNFPILKRPYTSYMVIIDWLNVFCFVVTWSPTAPQFVVVYGFMPAKATLFNKKCESLFDFGTGPRNMSLYNPQGNLVLLGGFGNLRGNMEIWDIKGKKRAAQFEAADATNVGWSADGQHLVTSTCAPRLRQGNG